MTCNSRLKTSGCAFSTSSSSTTLCGCLTTASVRSPALVEADVAGRRADQPRNRVALHVLGHVEAQQFDAHDAGKLAADLGLANAGWAGEQEAADRLALHLEAGARELDGASQGVDGLVLAEDGHLQARVEVAQRLLVRAGHLGRRDARDLRNHLLDIDDADRLLAPARRDQQLRRAGFVDHVDRLVGHERSVM